MSPVQEIHDLGTLMMASAKTDQVLVVTLFPSRAALLRVIGVVYDRGAEISHLSYSGQTSEQWGVLELGAKGAGATLGRHIRNLVEVIAVDAYVRPSGSIPDLKVSDARVDGVPHERSEQSVRPGSEQSVRPGNVRGQER